LWPEGHRSRHGQLQEQAVALRHRDFFGANKEVVGTGSITDGNYSISGVPVGPVNVSVSTPSVMAMAPERSHPPPKDMPGGATTPAAVIPAQYANPDQSGLEYTVQRGSQQHPIDLKWPPVELAAHGLGIDAE
jgi:hypothetical protein